MTLFALAAILEAIYFRIALLGDLRPRIVEAIGWLLLSGLFYLICTYIILRGRWGPTGPPHLSATASPQSAQATATPSAWSSTTPSKRTVAYSADANSEQMSQAD